MTRAWSAWDRLPVGFAAPLADMSSEDAAASAIVAAAATPLANVHLAAFNKNNIELWLSEHNTVFYLNNVTKAIAKYTLVRSKLPRTIMDV